MPTDPPTPSVTPLDVLAFACEIAMVVILVLAGHGIAGGATGWVLGVVLAMFSIGFWGAWMAPRSTRRLEHPLRLVVQIGLFLIVAVYAVAGGLAVVGLVFAVVAITTFVLRARQESGSLS